MKNTFLLQELLLENRIDDVKKKYPDVPTEFIERLSEADPSGTNKYLDWMAYVKSMSITMPNIIKHVNLFHKNVNKLNKEFLDELIEQRGWEWLLTDNSPIGRTFQKIYKSPKDINNYVDFGLATEILKAVDSKLTKSEVKKLEANVLYNSDDLLIMIPKSYRASCYYGAGTKWCTTNKDSDNYYNRYTEKGTLIYVINKKEPETNPWYKTAFLIEKGSGDVEVYDAPDIQKTVTNAYDNLKDKWEVIRDTIVEYLYKNNLKGIENFYFGQDLITWLESKDLDPLKFLNASDLIKKIGKDALINYLKKRDINIFTYFNFPELLDLFMSPDVIKKVWEGYKSVGINPLTKMFYNESPMSLVIDSVSKGDISLDEFLHFSSDPEFLKGSNIFSILNNTYGSKRTDDWWGSKIGPKLIELFKDVDLIFGYAKNIGVNLFDVIDVRGMNLLMVHKFGNQQQALSNALKYTLENKNHLKSALVNYGFPNELVLKYLSKLPNNLELVDSLIKNKLIKDLSLEDILNLYKDPKIVFKIWLEQRYGKITPSYEWNEVVYDVLRQKDIKKIFPTIGLFEKTIRELSNDEGWGIVNHGTSIKGLLKGFFDNNFYSLYKYFLDQGVVNRLNILQLIKAYDDAPVEEDTGLKKLVLDMAREELRGSKQSKLETRDNVDYVIFESLSRVLDLFNTQRDEYLLLDDDEHTFETYYDFSDITRFLDDEFTIKTIKDYLINNFRERSVTLDLDWLEEFDELGDRIKIDDVNGTFSFDLYDEVIEGLSAYKLINLIEVSPQFKKLKDVIKNVYDKVYQKELRLDAKNQLISSMEDIFGNDIMRIKNVKIKYTLSGVSDKPVYEFRYDYLMDDIIAFADGYVFHEDELPNSVYNLIQFLMENSEGRFDGYADADLENFVDSWNPNLKTFTEIFTNELYQTLSKLED